MCVKRAHLAYLALMVLISGSWRSPSPARAQGPCYDIVDLGTLGGTESTPEAINNHGQIVGVSFRADGYWGWHDGFLWADGEMRAIIPRGRYAGGATDINDLGWVSGYLDRDARMWRNGVLSAMPRIASSGTTAYGINARGDVCGVVRFDTGQYYAQLWPFDGERHQVSPFIAEPHSWAWAINDERELVGFSGWPDTPYAWTWDSSLGFRWLDRLPGGGHCWPYAINNRGLIAGWAKDGQGVYHAVLWEQDSLAITDLGRFAGDFALLLGLNDRGQAVGYFSTQGVSHAVLYHDGSWVDLKETIPPDSEWTQLAAFDINEQGQIAGQGMIGGRWHAFLMTPTDEELTIIDFAGCIDPREKGWAAQGGGFGIDARGMCEETAWLVRDTRGEINASRYYEQLIDDEAALYRATSEGWTLRTTLSVAGVNDTPDGSITVSFNDGDRSYTMLFGSDENNTLIMLQTDLEGGDCPQARGELLSAPGRGYHTYELRYNTVLRGAALYIDDVERFTTYFGHFSSIRHRGPGVLWGANSDCTIGAGAYRHITLEYTGLPGVNEGDVFGPKVNPANGNSYYGVYRTTWARAEQAAAGVGGHLVTINDAAEQDWVWSTFGDNGRRDLWIGLSDAAQEGTYKWADGNGTRFTNWAGGRPDDNCGGYNSGRRCAGGDYVLMSAADGGAWDDRCDLRRWGVVEVDHLDCEDLVRLKASCREGVLLVQIVLDGDDHDGETVTIDLNGRAKELTIKGDQAKKRFRRRSGTQSITVTDPPGCGLSQQVECV